jgi:hypothetical protein
VLQVSHYGRPRSGVWRRAQHRGRKCPSSWVLHAPEKQRRAHPPPPTPPTRPPPPPAPAPAAPPLFPPRAASSITACKCIPAPGIPRLVIAPVAGNLERGGLSHQPGADLRPLCALAMHPPPPPTFDHIACHKILKSTGCAQGGLVQLTGQNWGVRYQAGLSRYGRQ